MSKKFTIEDQFREKLHEMQYDSPFENVVHSDDACNAFEEVTLPLVELKEDLLDCIKDIENLICVEADKSDEIFELIQKAFRKNSKYENI